MCAHLWENVILKNDGKKDKIFEKLLKINFMEKSILRTVHNIDGPITVNISSFPFFFYGVFHVTVGSKPKRKHVSIKKENILTRLASTGNTKSDVDSTILFGPFERRFFSK